MKPHELKPTPGARKKGKRVGRGEGSGHGKTAGRGTKGTRARGTVRTFFEGGQMPLARRVPKLKGFRPVSRDVYAPVNLGDLSKLGVRDVGPEELRDAGLVHKRHDLIKVLAGGELDEPLTIRAHAVSEAARAKIEAAGGSVEVIDSSSRGVGA